jgi:preprotein translocase subunit SecD
MVIRFVRFNIYLLSLALLAGVTGCRSPEGRRARQLATLRVHIEVNRAMGELSEIVPIMRANPIMVNVERSPFLTEADVAKAEVVTDSLGGFALQIQFDERGSRLLEQYTAMNPGKRLAISAEFGQKPMEHRWLAAPLEKRRIGNGVLTFTPDATRDEAEQIAIGLNNVAIKSGNQEKPGKAKPKVE